MNFPRISIVTPSYNKGPYLEETILSVINQNYPNLEYIIIDGASTDESVDIIKKYSSHFSYWISEQDQGMYHAIQKGFAMSTGEIMGWINADDKLHHLSLFTLAELFSNFPEINWVHGLPSVIDEMGRIVFLGDQNGINKSFFYKKKHEKSRRYIQQESTFWRRDLWNKAGGYISQQYSYAGDFELWIRFFQHDKLWHLNLLIGAFRLARGQFTQDHYEDYINEARQILECNPQSKEELRKMRYSEIIDKIEKKISSIINSFKFRLRLPDRSVIRGRIYFDPTTQRFESRQKN